MCIVLSYSEAGDHLANEDAFEVLRHPEGHSCWIGALADGQGGRSGGAYLSRPDSRGREATTGSGTKPVSPTLTRRLDERK
jgi:serine/threonine protein phosphatase PrpC